MIIIGVIGSLLFRLWESRWQGFFLWGTGFIVPILILYPFFLLKGMGAGDIKIFAVLGSGFGISFALKLIAVSILFGGVMALIKMFYSNNFFLRLQYLATYISQTVLCKKLVPYYDKEQQGRECVIHFSIAILFGFCTTLGMEYGYIVI